jgi:fatty-acid desaturase
MLTFWVVFLLSWLYHGMGITVGYHRLLSHRAFKCPKLLEYMIVSGGYLALEGSPVSWVATHRVHHRYSDHEGDPHSPVHGMWHSFAGWLLKPRVRFANEQIEQIVPDLWRDPVYRFFDFNHERKHALVCLGLCILLRVAIFIYLGPVALLANIMGMLTAFIGPFWVNSVCHLKEFGYRNFATEDGSRNVWWVGLIGLGEGWHNNHHAVPQSARHGMKPSEFDISWYFIKFLSLIGLVTDIRLPKGSLSTPVLDAALAAELNVPCATDTVLANGQLSAQLAAAKADLQQQLESARALADKLLHSCENLNTEVLNAKAGLTSNVSATKDQINNAGNHLTEQLLAACDELSRDLVLAKEQFGEQLRSGADNATRAIITRSEAETA